MSEVNAGSSAALCSRLPAACICLTQAAALRQAVGPPCVPTLAAPQWTAAA